jgi:Gas vesicle protein K
VPHLPTTGTAMLDLEENNLRHGLLALTVALLEVIKEALVHAALRRVEGGRLSDAEVERLGDALAELEEAVAQIKVEHGVEEAVQSVRDDLDQVVGRIIDTMAGRERWSQELEREHAPRA